MITRLGKLAAVGRRALVSKKACLMAASLLTISFLLSGCSGIFGPGTGPRFFQAIADLLKLLPESVPTTPMEIFEAVLGANFAETFEQWMMTIVQKPVINEDIFGAILYWFTALVLFIVLAYGARYIWNLFSMAGEEGSDQVLEGNTDLLPPHSYFFKRLIPTMVVLAAAPALVQASLNFSWRIVTDTATAMYTDAGSSVGTVMYDVIQSMLEGARVWLFLIMFVAAILLLFLVLVFYAWRYISVFLYTLKMMARIPHFLGGKATSYSLTEPIVGVLHRVAVLGITWFMLLIGPLLINALDLKGIPSAIGLLVTEILVISLPWILLGLGGVAASRIYPKVRSFVSYVDTDLRDPAPVKGISIRKRAWERTKAGSGKVLRVGKEVAKRHPEIGPAVIATETVVGTIRNGRDDEIARMVTESAPLRRSFQGSSDPGSSEGQIVNRFINMARNSIFRDHEYLSDGVFALCIELASGSSGMTKQQIIDEANAQYAAMNSDERNLWREIGRRVKRAI